MENGKKEEIVQCRGARKEDLLDELDQQEDDPTTCSVPGRYNNNEEDGKPLTFTSFRRRSVSVRALFYCSDIEYQCCIRMRVST